MSRHDTMTSEDIILPEGVLDQIEQHTITVARKRKKLKKLGYAPQAGHPAARPSGHGQDPHHPLPGQSQMKDSTVVILPKQAIGMAHELVDDPRAGRHRARTTSTWSPRTGRLPGMTEQATCCSRCSRPSTACTTPTTCCSS